MPDDLALTKAFAKDYRLRLAYDDCGDLILDGRKGHLYFADGELCAMWTDASPIEPTKLKRLGRWSWHGLGLGARVQDAWVKGIPPESYTLAIRLAGCKRQRTLSPEHRQKLVGGGSQNRFTTGLNGDLQS